MSILSSSPAKAMQRATRAKATFITANANRAETVLERVSARPERLV